MRQSSLLLQFCCFARLLRTTSCLSDPRRTLNSVAACRQRILHQTEQQVDHCATKLLYSSVYPKGEPPCCKMSSSSNEPIIQRLEGIQGDGDKKNDIVFCGRPCVLPKGHTIFFGGDIQDYPEMMLAHRDNKRYVDHNVENTAQLLAIQFPENDIWLIKPKNMYLKTFSVFANFVESSDIGNPDHSEGQSSWAHLSELFKNALERVRPESPRSTSIDLVGFSKGCVVLNQLLYDMDSAKSNSATSDFLKMVGNMYWLDGGHNGGSGIWITDEAILEHLKDTGIHVHSHVTPYQMNDPMRKWIRKEHKKFVERIDKYTKVTNTLHFGEEQRSIERHFEVLKEFSK